MDVPYSFELAFAFPLGKHFKFYKLGRHSILSTYNSLPCTDFDVWCIVNRCSLPDTGDISKLENEISDMIYQDLELMNDSDIYRDESGHQPEMFPDNNGYRLLCKSNLYNLWAEREGWEEELDDEDYDEDNIREEIKEIDEQLVEEIKKVKRFYEVAADYIKYLPETIEECYNETKEIVRQEDDDEWFFIEQEEYFDVKEDERLIRWDKKTKKEVDERVYTPTKPRDGTKQTRLQDGKA